LIIMFQGIIDSDVTGIDTQGDLFGDRNS